MGGAVAVVAVNDFSMGSRYRTSGPLVLIVFLVWYIGRRIRIRGDYLSLLQERATHLEREQEAEARRAVAEERTRIARELHDVVAHRVSLMTVQAGAAKTVAADDPQGALQAMEAVEQEGRQTLGELRHLLGVLRPEADVDELGPQPGILQIFPGSSTTSERQGWTFRSRWMVFRPSSRLAWISPRTASSKRHSLTCSSTPDPMLGPRFASVPITMRLPSRCSIAGHGATILPGSGHGIVRHARAGTAVRWKPRCAGPRPGGGFQVVAHLPIGEEPTMSIRVVVVDDQALVRGGFAMVLGHQEDIEVVAEAGTGLGAIEAARTHRPDVILMDIRMPDMDGLEATARIVKEADWPVRVLILTTFDPDEYVYKALRAGASGFVLKDIPPEELVTAVRTVADGGALLAPSITRRLIGQFAKGLAVDTKVSSRLDRLSNREREVLAAIARGLNNTEISEELFIGAATVKSHVSNILTKLGLRDRAQAVVFAYECGLTKAGDHDIGY